MLTVNLTTTLQRLALCRIALISLATQSRRPDCINLWISRSAYLRDAGIKESSLSGDFLESLPDVVTELLRIRWTENIGPYRKLIPVLREASPDDIIITADDDIFYGKNWLAILMKNFECYGGEVVVGGRVREVSVNFMGVKTSYLHWKMAVKSKFSAENFVITFGGGAVLKREHFLESDIENESYLSVAPTADDLWYSELLQRKGTKVYISTEALSELHFVHHNDGLVNSNLPKAVSKLGSITSRAWSLLSGYFGFQVCGNDRAYKRIKKYFRESQYAPVDRS